MLDLAKVIKAIEGLRCCLQYNMTGQECDICPYSEDCGTDGEPLMRDALALLQATVPRVMTVDEMLEPDRYFGGQGSFWVELRNGDLFPVIALYTPYRGPMEHITIIMNGAYMCTYLEQNECGVTWRPWSALPSEKQKKEAGWDADYVEQEAAE